jgi:hypothetical protein
MKVLILNGPPGCGKDTIARLLCKFAPVLQGEFKEILYLHTAMLLSKIGDDIVGDSGYFGLSAEEVRERNEDRELKDTPWIGGLSVRRWLQITSEMVVKKDRGQDYFGVASADRWHSKGTDHVISDCGFIEEVDAVVDRFGAENVYVIRLHREGFSFAVDTRYYIKYSNAQELDFTLRAGYPMEPVEFLHTLLTK